MSIDLNTISYFDENRALQSASTRDFVQLIFQHPPHAESGAQRAEGSGISTINPTNETNAAVVARNDRSREQVRLLSETLDALRELERLKLENQKLIERMPDIVGHVEKQEELLSRTIALQDRLGRITRGEPVGPLNPTETDQANPTTTEPQPSHPTPRGLVQLIDGQRLPGRWLGTPPPPTITPHAEPEQSEGSGISNISNPNPTETLRWRHPLLGELHLPLNRLHLIHSHTPGSSQAAQVKPKNNQLDDRIQLRNGDTITGFVTAIDNAGIRLQPTNHPHGADLNNPADVLIEVDRFAYVQLINPTEVNTTAPLQVTFADGTHLFANDLLITDEQVQLVVPIPSADDQTPEERLIQVDLQTIQTLDIRLAGKHVAPLEEVATLQVLAGGRAFGVPFPPRYDQQHLHLNAPLTLAIDLPYEVTHLATIAKLDDTDPDVDLNRLETWANFTVTFASDHFAASLANDLANEMAFPINGTQTQHELNLQFNAELNLEFEGSRLLITLDPLDEGPILDRLLLHHPRVLLQYQP